MEKNKLLYDKMSENIIQVAEKLATTNGSASVTVRSILRELNISNRVFYNRFQNIEEVLSIVYSNTVSKLRESLDVEYDGNQDFFDYIADCVVNALIMSYDIKMKFNQYVFENDSLSQSNYEWYISRIKLFFDYAKKHELIKDLDVDALSYAIWCFCRGYNADAVMRLPKDEAVEKFKYSFKVLLNGLKKQ